MKLSDLVLFVLALIAFIFGTNYMISQKSVRPPINVTKLLENLNVDQGSELNQALKKVTSKAKGADLPIDIGGNPYEAKFKYVDFLLTREDFKPKAIEFFESEMKSFDFKNTNVDSRAYLEKVFVSYLKVQKNTLQALAVWVELKKNLEEHPLILDLEPKLLEAFPKDREMLIQKLNSK